MAQKSRPSLVPNVAEKIRPRPQRAKGGRSISEREP